METEADRSLSQRLIGSWALVSYVQSFDDGRDDVLPMGDKPAGLIMYTIDGHMSAQLGPADRQQFASALITDGMAEEYAQAARSYIAYSGRFSCDADRGTVTHHVDVSLFPNWVGGDQVRDIAFLDNFLRLRTLPGASGSQTGAIQTLTWRRAR